MSRELAPRLVAVICASVIAAVVFAVSEESGGFGLTSRTVVSATTWALLILAVGFGAVRLPATAARVCCTLFAAFAAWTLLSAIWGASAEHAVIEFDRVALYLGVLLLAVLAVPRRWLADGLFIGITAVTIVSLTTRFFPHVFGAHLTPLPSAATRLSYPVGYWNGLGILVTLGLPLALRVVTVGRGPFSRGAAVAVFPLVACVVYLTSSRGAAVTAAVGVVVFLMATDRRWRGLGAACAGAAGSLLAVAALASRHALVDGPLSSGAAAGQGRSMGLVLVGCMALSALIYVAGDALLGTRGVPPAALGRVLVVLAVIVLAIAAVASHPVRRFDDFKRPIPTAQAGSGAHLLSGNGSGRWQFWASALDEFRSAPVAGRGAGSFPAWWSQHASFTYFVQNAHSLYLEVLGELGLVGFLLLVGAFCAGLAGCVTALRSSGGELRTTVAAGTGVFAAFLVGAAVDWIWQLTAVGMVGLGGLAMAIRAPAHTPGRGRTLGVGVALIVVAWAIVLVAALPWLTARRIADSQAAVRRHDVAAALRSALDAKVLEPWAASPYVQLALVDESEGRLAEGRRRILQAINRDDTDWRSWYLASRIEGEAGLRGAASRSYARARELNPLSQVFAPRSR